MPTLAELQALREQQPSAQDVPTVPKQPTFADLQALRGQNTDVQPAAPEGPKRPGFGEKALGVLAAPGFAVGESVMHPRETNKIVTSGIMDLPKDIWNKEKSDVQGVVSGFKGAMDPNRSVGSRVLQGGKSALNAIAMPFEPLVAGVENTYGRVASEGSKMTQPDNKPLIGPGSASLLPTLFVGSGKKKATEFADAAGRFGMNFSKAKEPEDIAKEIGRATDDYFSKLGSMIWDRTPAATKTGTLGEVGSNALKNFTQRKSEETKLWTDAETAGNQITKDHTNEINRLKEMRAQVTERIKNGEDTTDVKKSQAMIDRALGELGAPVEPEQKIIEKVKEVGGRTSVTNADRQFAPKNQETTKNVQPTSVLGGKTFAERSQTPIRSALSQEGKIKRVETSPYTVTTRTVKGNAPSAPRAGTASDLVRARRAANDGAYAAADPAVSKEVKNVLQGGLADVAKTNKEFGRMHNMALQKTQANADIYRDDAKAKEFGFDENTLKDLQAKIKSGRELSTDTLEKINTGMDKVKTPEDLLFLQRHLDKPEFSMALRAKAATILSDAGTDIKKVEKQRPMLEKIFEFSGMPKAKIKTSLDDLETVSKEMRRFSIPTKPEVDPELTKTQQRVQSLVKALTFGGLFGNPKQGGFHAIQALAPKTQNASHLALQALRKKALPPPVTANGPAVAGAMNAIGAPNMSGAITGQSQ